MIKKWSLISISLLFKAVNIFYNLFNYFEVNYDEFQFFDIESSYLSLSLSYTFENLLISCISILQRTW